MTVPAVAILMKDPETGKLHAIHCPHCNEVWRLWYVSGPKEIGGTYRCGVCARTFKVSHKLMKQIEY